MTKLLMIVSGTKGHQPFDAKLDEFVSGNALAKLRAAAVNALVKPAVRVDSHSLQRHE